MGILTDGDNLKKNLMGFIRERERAVRKQRQEKRGRTVCVNETDGQNRKEIC